MSDSSGAPMIRTEKLSKEFNGFQAVSDVDLSVADGSLHALVGPNGAGKTTMFNMLTGFLPCSAGSVFIGGEDVTGRKPEQIARHGVARSFQITKLFDELSLREHVELALQGREGGGFRFWRSDRLLDHYADRTHELLTEPSRVLGRSQMGCGSRLRAA